MLQGNMKVKNHKSNKKLEENKSLSNTVETLF